MSIDAATTFSLACEKPNTAMPGESSLSDCMLRYNAIQTSHWLLLPVAALRYLLSHALTDYTHFYIIDLAF
jgi:hypothetical protein